MIDQETRVLPRTKKLNEREEGSQLSKSQGYLYHDKFHWFNSNVALNNINNILQGRQGGRATNVL